MKKILLNNNALITNAFFKLASVFQIVSFTSDKNATKSNNYLQTCDYSFELRAGYNTFILDIDYHCNLKSFKIKHGGILQDIELNLSNLNLIQFIAENFKKKQS